MGTLLTVGQIGKPCSALLKTGAAIIHCHVCRFPAPSGPLAGVPPLLLTVAALRFPGTSCPPIAPLPRIALAPSATGGASGDSSKSAHLLCHRRRFPAKTPSGQPISGPKRGRKPGPFLETSSLFPPPAALRLLYTVAALVIPASDKAEITAAASKAGRFFCLRQHFPAFHITRWKTLCIMWKTSRYVILWKSCENFAHPLCTAKVL